MTAASETAGKTGVLRQRTRFERLKENRKLWRGAAAVLTTLVLWEIGSRDRKSVV